MKLIALCALLAMAGCQGSMSDAEYAYKLQQTQQILGNYNANQQANRYAMPPPPPMPLNCTSQRLGNQVQTRCN